MYFTPIIPTDSKGNIDIKILDKAQDVYANSSKLTSFYNENIIKSLEDLFETVNLYFTCKLEKQQIQPEYIYNAKYGNFSDILHVKELQFLTLYHVHMQNYLTQKAPTYENLYSQNMILDLHERFYSQLGMDTFLQRKNQNEILNMYPGKYRDVNFIIRKEQTPSFRLINLLLNNFETHYGVSKNHDKITNLVFAFCSYHRFIWIYPFMYSNEFIARMILNFLLEQINIQGSKLWSISRGINEQFISYQKALFDANEKVQTINDGKGPLSNSGLEKFLFFMLNMANDQINFTHKNLILLPQRIKNYVKLSQNGFFDKEPLPKGSDVLFEKLLIYGELPRGEMKKIIQKQNRSATYFTNKLTQLDFIHSDTPRGNIKLKFNLHFASKLFPELFPQ